jgi:hypothetical protein
MEKREEQGRALRLEQEHAGELARPTSRAGGSSGRTRQRKLGGRESRLEGGVNWQKLKFTTLNTTTSWG